MPFLTTQVPDKNILVQRPIYFKTVEAALAQLGLLKRFTVLWVNDDGDVINPNSLAGQQDQTFQFVTDAKHAVYVEAQEDTNTDYQLINRVNVRNHPPIWYDKDNGLSISPQYHYADAKLSLQFQFTSRTQAERMYSTLKRKLVINNRFEVFAEYRLAIPDRGLDVINEYFKRIKRAYEPELTLLEYLRRHSSAPLVELFRLDKTLDGFAVIETQHGILAQHETTMAPELQRGSNGIWTTTLDIKLQYQCPVDYVIEYRPMVGRISLPKPLIADVNEHEYEHFLDYHDSAWHRFAAITESAPVINLPKWDKFFPKQPVYLHPFFTVLTNPKPETGVLLNLNKKLGDYQLSKAALRYLIHFNEDIHDWHKHPISIAVYRDDTMLSRDNWTFTPEGEVTLLSPDDTRTLVRVVVNGNLNWEKLSLPDFQEVVDSGDILRDVVPIFIPKLPIETIPTHPNGNIKPDAMLEIAKEVNQRYQQGNLGPANISAMVGTFHLLIDREK